MSQTTATLEQKRVENQNSLNEVINNLRLELATGHLRTLACIVIRDDGNMGIVTAVHEADGMSVLANTVLLQHIVTHSSAVPTAMGAPAAAPPSTTTVN